MKDKIFTISEYMDLINRGLKEFSVKIIGEVGKIDIGPSGHIYFSLRDEKDQSVINCIIWADRYEMYGIKLEEGLKIISYGCPNIYPKTGKFSFVAETIELAGEGMLKKAYEKLKAELTKEGIFEESKKRPIPKYPEKIGLITSKQGAVLGDFLTNIGKYGFKIKMIDSRVEGQSAIEDLLLSIKTFKKEDIEVLVIMRGGGSFESMQAFNNEIIVREIANFPVPVISAIGHDRDFSLVSLASDFDVSTPSMAAVKIGESWKESTLFLERYERKIIEDYKVNLGDAYHLIDESTEKVKEYSDFITGIYRKVEGELKIALQNFNNNLLNTKNNLNIFKNNLSNDFVNIISMINQRLENSENIIFLNNPERQLKLGYSIAKSNNKIIKSINNIWIGRDINLLVSDGEIISEVKSINKIN